MAFNYYEIISICLVFVEVNLMHFDLYKRCVSNLTNVKIRWTNTTQIKTFQPPFRSLVPVSNT